ncbi:MAG: FAD-dependent oxidoreductase [Bacteroidales bacterium]
MLDGKKHRIAVIGAGPAGAAAAISAAAMGMEVDWYDKENRPGGKLNDYHQLFPDRSSAEQILADFEGRTEAIEIKKHFGTAVNRIETDNRQLILLSDNEIVGNADSVIVATGFDFFDARLKEEFGYGIYNHVITSPDLEQILKTNPEDLRKEGADPASIAFVHCVGSRDQQAGINYCSRLCCITGIKQAIEIKELFPSCKVVNFYIDIRAFGSGYEELYREAQEKYKVQFIRGRVSEASENQQHRILLKAEDTLMARPLKLTVDWLVLLVGMVPSCTQVQIDNHQCTDQETGFYQPVNAFTGSRMAGQPGIFTAGACGGPMSIPEATASGRSAALEAWQYIKDR